MKRELIFRAWHNELKEMFWFDLMNGQSGKSGGGYIPMVRINEPLSKSRYRDNEILIDPTNCEVMQFTGLTDKNGNRIFEGDIVKCPTATEPEENGFIVVFNKCKWCFLNVNYPDLDIYGSDNWEYFSNYSEVIGNIHQNHELI